MNSWQNCRQLSRVGCFRPPPSRNAQSRPRPTCLSPIYASATCKEYPHARRPLMSAVTLIPLLKHCCLRPSAARRLRTAPRRLHLHDQHRRMPRWRHGAAEVIDGPGLCLYNCAFDKGALAEANAAWARSPFLGAAKKTIRCQGTTQDLSQT